MATTSAGVTASLIRDPMVEHQIGVPSFQKLQRDIEILHHLYTIKAYAQRVIHCSIDRMYPHLSPYFYVVGCVAVRSLTGCDPHQCV